MITIRIRETGGEKARKHVADLERRILVGAERGLARALKHAEGVSQRNYFTDYANNTRANRKFIGPTFPILRNRTRRLRDSITSTTRSEARRVIGVLGTNVIYGRIHELGYHGTTADGRTLNYDGRPYLAPAVRDSLGIIQREVPKAIREEINRNS